MSRASAILHPAGRRSDTKRKLKVKVSAVREQTVEVASVLVRARCPACGCQVDVVTPAQAAQFLEVGDSFLQRLIADGKVHAVETAGGTILLCKESLS